MAECWWSLEILDSSRMTGSRWREAHSAALIEAAISHGAKDWFWHELSWGVVLELAFEEWDAWSVFRALPAVTAALDSAPDPVNGVLIYPGRGGSSGERMPRRPVPPIGAGAAPIPPLPDDVYQDRTGLPRVLAAV